MNSKLATKLITENKELGLKVKSNEYCDCENVVDFVEIG